MQCRASIRIGAWQTRRRRRPVCYQSQSTTTTRSSNPPVAVHDPLPISCKTDMNYILSSSRPRSASTKAPQKLKVIDETSIAGAQHKPSMGGASLAHLVSELSATSPQMLRDGLRVEGQTMDETSRAAVRQTAKWLMGFPLLVGGVWVGWEWSRGHFNAAGGSKAPDTDAPN